MIKKFKLYILLAAVVLSTTSCLDKMPEDSIPFDEIGRASCRERV